MKIVLFAFAHMEYTIELAEALAMKEEALLFIPENRAKNFANVINNNLSIYPYARPRLRSPFNILMLLKVYYKIITFRPDVIHLQGEHPWFDLTSPFLARKYPIVLTVHDVILHSGDESSTRIPSFFYEINRKFAHKIIVHGKHLKQEMLETSRFSANDIHILPRGVNSIYKRYITQTADEEKYSILFFGRIWPYKGLGYLIEAEPKVSKVFPDLKIVIAGRGEDFNRYREMMVNKEKFVVYNEYISNETVNKLFQKASVIVLPYTDASQSGVIPMAYSFKKPVIATNVGSLPEVVDHGETGLIVPPKDSDKLADAIIGLFSDTKKLKEMGEKAFIKSNEDLSWERIAVNTTEIYKEAILSKN